MFLLTTQSLAFLITKIIHSIFQVIWLNIFFHFSVHFVKQHTVFLIFHLFSNWFIFNIFCHQNKFPSNIFEQNIPSNLIYTKKKQVNNCLHKQMIFFYSDYLFLVLENREEQKIKTLRKRKKFSFSGQTFDTVIEFMLGSRWRRRQKSQSMSGTKRGWTTLARSLTYLHLRFYSIPQN